MERPPERSSSASWREVRSSKRESPPSIAARKGESGVRMRAIWERWEGRSLIQWREREERMAEKEEGGKGRGVLEVGSGRVRRVWVKGRGEEERWESGSRWRRVGDGSADVRWERRVDRGAEEEGEEGASGGGAEAWLEERMRAILQALAPRSRTVGKCRFMSCKRESIGADI